MSSSPASADKSVDEPRRPASIEDLLRAHRRELLVHCYRMLGSWTDAEDVMQDVSLRAWRGLDRFEARSSTRSWLYRIATNACLSARRSRAQRTLPEIAVPPVPLGAVPAPPIEEARWIQPFPSGPDVEAMASSRESVTLAFVLALQHLPPRQRAALLLRDVVGYEASEVAAMLKTSTPAINSALIRARARLDRFRERRGIAEKVTPLTPAQHQVLRHWVRAWEAGDVDGIVALLSRDAIVSMPPFATWYRGRVAIARWLAENTFAVERVFRVFPTSANGRPAFAFYSSGGPCLPGEPVRHILAPHSIQMVWLAGQKITRIIHFLDERLVHEFGFGPRPPERSSKK
jgi:RNA polymerase sigma-70 factor (ECF subfamily)